MIAIYQIRNIKNNASYIGSSIDTKKRFQTHRRMLCKNIHHSIYLQRAWNKYGEKNFKFEIIRICNQYNLLKWEQIYLNLNSSVYNVSKSAIAPMKNRKHSLKTKTKLSKIHKGHTYNLGRKASLEEKIQRSIMRTGYKHSIKTKLKMSKTAKKLNSINRIDRSKRMKKIKDNIGNQFESIAECSKFWKISSSTICDILKGRHIQTRLGIIFDYV